MSSEHRSGRADEMADQDRPENKQTEGVSRRKAFGRFLGYTAPAMLALLASEAHALIASPMQE